MFLAVWLLPAVQFPLRELATQDKLDRVLQFKGQAVAQLEEVCGGLGTTAGHRNCYTDTPWYAPLGRSCIRVVNVEGRVVEVVYDDD